MNMSFEAKKLIILIRRSVEEKGMSGRKTLASICISSLKKLLGSLLESFHIAGRMPWAD